MKREKFGLQRNYIKILSARNNRKLKRFHTCLSVSVMLSLLAVPASLAYAAGPVCVKCPV